MSSTDPERRHVFEHAAAPFAAALLVLVFGAVTYASVRDEQVSSASVRRTYAVIEQDQALFARLVDAETGERGFIITGNTSYLEPYRGAAAEAAQHLAALKQLTADNPGQQVRIATLGPLLERRVAQLQSRITARQSQGFDSARVALLRSAGGKATMDSVRQVVAAINGEEQHLLGLRLARRAQIANAVLITVIGGSVVAAIIGLLLNLRLARYATTVANLATNLDGHSKELEAANQHLQDQAMELENQTSELEMLNEELQSANSELEERTAEAETANRTKGQFLSRMSHDLRTPINAIIGYTDLMQLGLRGPVTPAQLEDLGHVKRSSTHLLVLINDLLSFAKLEAGHIQLRMTDVRVRDVLASLAPLLGPRPRGQRLEVDVEHCDPALWVRVDRGRLEQILLNLLGNAVKFTPQDGRIWVECTADEDEVRLAVGDTGPGIPPEHLETIFEPFVQLDGQPFPEHSRGVGLGLAISRQLARVMDAELTVQSVVGGGSTFTLHLPRS